MQTSSESDSLWKRPEEKNLAKIHLSTLPIFLMQLFSQIRYACASCIAFSSHLGQTEDVQQMVLLCAKFKVPIVPYGHGTSLEGHTSPHRGGILQYFLKYSLQHPNRRNGQL